MLESLGNILRKSVDKITSAIFVDKTLVESIVKDLQRALIMADVNIALVSEISSKIRKEGESYVKGVEKKEHLIKLLNDEIQRIIGGEKKELILGKKDTILFVGLYGTGKTTTISKIAAYYKKRGKNPALLGLDVYRPAASEQLEQLSKKIEVPVFTDKNEKNPLKIYDKYKKDLEKYDLIISSARKILSTHPPSIPSSLASNAVNLRRTKNKEAKNGTQITQKKQISADFYLCESIVSVSSVFY